MQGKDLSEAISNRESIERIKRLYLSGKIDRKVAEALASPTIARINERQAEIYRKWGKKNFPKTNFVSLMR